MSPWPCVSLGNLIRLERRPIELVADRKYQEIGIYSYGRGIFHKTPRTGLEVGDKNLFLMREGDLILQVTFAWEGAIALCSRAEDGLYGSVRYPTFRVDERQCFAPYLRHYLCTAEGLEQIGRICPGSAGRNRVLALKRVPEITVPLPPLDEQRRIVERIESVAGKIDEARELRNQASSEADALLRSILFGDSSATLVPMSGLVSQRAPEVEVEPSGSYRFAGVYCFGRGVFRGAERQGIEFSYDRLSRLRAGDFIYPKLMAWEGALAVVPKECDGLFVSPEFPVFEIDQSKVLPEVLDIYFRTPFVWPTLSGASTGTNVRRRRLNPVDFLRHKMPLPNAATQALLRDTKRKIDAAKQLYDDTATEMAAIFPAVVGYAFRGQLPVA